VSPSNGLCLSAHDHAHDLGSRGATGHAGADGTTPADRVSRYGTWLRGCGEVIWFGTRAPAHVIADALVDLIIDDGVPSRGHRTNLFNPKFAVAGAAAAPHAIFGHVLVIELAGEYAQDPPCVEAREAAGPPPVPEHPVQQPGQGGTHWSLGMCPMCGKAIQGGRVVTPEAAPGVPGAVKFHAVCFACARCARPLSGVPFRREEYAAHAASGARASGSPATAFVCVPCYDAAHAQPCAGCGQPIRGSDARNAAKVHVKANGKPYHRVCLRCARCRTALTGSKCTVYGNSLLCSACAGGPLLPTVTTTARKALARGQDGKASTATRRTRSVERRVDIARDQPRSMPGRTDGSARAPHLQQTVGRNQIPTGGSRDTDRSRRNTEAAARTALGDLSRAYSSLDL